MSDTDKHLESIASSLAALSLFGLIWTGYGLLCVVVEFLRWLSYAIS